MAGALWKKLRSSGKRPGPLDLYFGALSGDALREAEETFFPGLQLSNGTFKTTRPHRLDELNKMLRGCLPHDHGLKIMDVGVSSGVTTAEWSEDLNAHGISHSMVASDLSVTGLLWAPGRRIGVLWQMDGNPLVVQMGSRSVYLMAQNPVSWFVKPLLRVARPFVRRFSHQVPLVSTRLAGLGITVVEDDVTQPGRFYGRFDVVRAANLVNREYFDEDTLRLIARNLFDRLVPDGLLVVCRTRNEDRVTEVTVIRRSGESGEIVGRLNGGCDVEPLLAAASGVVRAVG